jgi:hypothetical protein
MGGVYSTYGIRERLIQVFGRETRDCDHLGDPGVDGRIILKLIFKMHNEAWSGFSWLRIETGGWQL